MYYRNLEDLVSLEGIEVEAGSLWKLERNGKRLVLVDDDQYCSAPMDQSKFEIDKIERGISKNMTTQLSPCSQGLFY